MPEVLFDAAARRRLRTGVDTLADAVRVTLGPRGRTVVLGAASGAGAGPPTVADDGATVAAALELPDPYADLGRQLVREVAARTNAVAGDGATTAVVLAQAMTHLGLRAVEAGAQPEALRHGMDVAAHAAVTALHSLARPAAGRDLLRAVAANAAGDQRVGELVADAFGKVGRDGVVSVDESRADGVDLEFADGLRLGNGYLSPAMATEPDQARAVLDDAWVLLHHGKISDLDQLLPLLEQVYPTRRPLLLVADDVRREALSMLLFNKLRGVFTAVAVKAPALGNRRLAHLEDLAALTGGRVVAPEAGLKLARAGIDVLGRAYRVVVTEHETQVIGGAGAPADLEARVDGVRHQLAAAESDWEREVLRERLGALTGGACVIRVGAATDVELADRRRRVADAVAATRAALRDGVVAGGGSALVHAGRAAGAGVGLTGDELIGADVVRLALAEPLRWIARNAGADGDLVAARVAALTDGHGFDAESGRYGDLEAAGVVDPVAVVRAAVHNATSMVGLLLTTAALVVDGHRPDPAELDGGGLSHGHGHGHGHGH
ncbi:Hsp60 family chaperonin [Jiangella asiatica]|uniref:60 kDa chaperonin n=1 Tax=Jiangella asiatica TaxID=2530372 RepID=A0A4R5C8F1_9ACTN|nr:molecular chaperone GroEL [Jiangella asiatica]TDD96121.1 molecular chaperone GroEL [Jiangella asiatica]